MNSLWSMSAGANILTPHQHLCCQSVFESTA